MGKEMLKKINTAKNMVVFIHFFFQWFSAIIYKKDECNFIYLWI